MLIHRCVTVLNYNDILNQNIDTLQAGQYIWTALEKNPNNFPVYKYVGSGFKIQSVGKSENNVFKITLNSEPNFEAGDIIGIKEVGDENNGFFTVNKVELNVLSCNSVEDVPQTEEDKYDGEGFLTYFKKVRVANLTEANANIQESDVTPLLLAIYPTGQTIWVDDDDTGKWTVLKSKQVYELKSNTNTTAGLLDSTKDFGSAYLAQKTTTQWLLLFKDLNGSVYILSDPVTILKRLLQQIDEQAFLYDSNGGFGTSAFYRDGKTGIDRQCIQM